MNSVQHTQPLYCLDLTVFCFSYIFLSEVPDLCFPNTSAFVSEKKSPSKAITLVSPFFITLVIYIIYSTAPCLDVPFDNFPEIEKNPDT
jgi:hypothetical protein